MRSPKSVHNIGSGAVKKYDLDLSKMGAEELVVLAQECGFRPAADELLLRFHEPMCRLIGHKARYTPLTQPDIQDAQQNTVFAILEAIRRYRTPEMVKPGGCKFGTYAHMVTTRRFVDFAKRVSRMQKRYCCLPRPGERYHQDCSALAPSSFLERRLDDPTEAAARKEALARLAAALEGSDDEVRALWHELAAGKSLRQIARQRGVDYDALKRQRRKLLRWLKGKLADWEEV
jgi:RNA polymerase sigma factor (sigma-70 family)